MKNKYILLALLLVPFIAGIVSCDDDRNDDFLGTDNFIHKFELIVDQTTYEGSVTDEQILVTFPTGLSLSDAAASVEFCEHATIEPEPAAIKDWSEEMQLTVTAYNGEKRVYTYKPAFSDLAVEGNIVLTTQEEVDAFGKTGTTVIHGNLTIGVDADSEDRITDLSALSRLKEVDYKLIVYKSFVGKTLAGLDNLEKAGGLDISDIDSLTGISLPKLKEVGLEVTLSGKSLKKVALPVLAVITEDLTVKGDSLTELLFSELVKVQGNLILQGSVGTALANPMETLSLPKLEEVDGDFLLDYWAHLAQLDLPVLKHVAGLLTLNNMRKVSVLSLPLLEKAGGITAAGLRTLAEYHLPALKEIVGYKDASGNDNGGFVFSASGDYLESVNLPLLEKVQGDFKITNFYSEAEKLELKTPNLHTITGSLSVRSSSSKQIFSKFNDVSSFDKLTSASKVDIRYFPELYDFTGLKNVIPSLSGDYDWSVSRCGYSPTMEDMKAGKYKPVE